MKVENKYVEIKVGNKTFIRKNMLMDIYLERIFNSQLDIDHDTSAIDSCFIKFDKDMGSVYPNNELNYQDFDVIFLNSTKDIVVGENRFEKMSETNKNNIKIIYRFNNEGIYYSNNEYRTMNDFEVFNNHKITAIAFGNGTDIFAFLDTSNMNIVVNPSEEISITRVDVFKSDGICKGFDYPLHLVNDSAHYDTEYQQISEYETLTIETRSQLYSVGFGSYEGVMEEEYLIDNLPYSRSYFDITFDIIHERKHGIGPSNNLRLGFYPKKDTSKYVILKYRLYRHYSDNTNEYLDEYYTMNYKNNKRLIMNINLKIERL